MPAEPFIEPGFHSSKEAAIRYDRHFEERDEAKCMINLRPEIVQALENNQELVSLLGGKRVLS